MFIELLDILRCVRPHEDSWLVASFDALVGRHVLRGTLGCPVCGAEYPVVEGVVQFGDATAQAGIAPEREPGPDGLVPLTDDPAAALRLAAMLGLDETDGVVLLLGRWAAHADALGAIVPGARLLQVNAVGALRPFASAVTTGAVLPLAASSVRAIAFDAAAVPALTPDAAVRVLAPGGRLVARGSDPVPPGVTELARDAADWVARRDAADEHGPVVRLTRRGGGGGGGVAPSR